MELKTILKVDVVVFSVVALLHLLRVAMGWTFVVGDIYVSQWVSWVAVVFAGFLAYANYQALNNHKPKK